MSLDTARAVIVSHLGAADDAAGEAGASREASFLKTVFLRLEFGIRDRDPSRIGHAADALRKLAALYAARAATEEAAREKGDDGPPHPCSGDPRVLATYGNRSL